MTSTSLAGVISVLGNYLSHLTFVTVAVAVYYIHNNHSADAAELVNDWAGRAVITLVFVQFLFTVLPKWFWTKKKVTVHWLMHSG